MIFIRGLIIGVVVLVRDMTWGGMKNASAEHRAPDTVDILKERYARGRSAPGN